MIRNDDGDFFLYTLDEVEPKTEQHFNFAKQMPSLFFYGIKVQPKVGFSPLFVSSANGH